MDPLSLTRRALLAGSGAALTASAGCLGRVGTLSDRPDREQLTVDIKTLPADSDPFAMQIASHLTTGLEAVGIDYRLTPTVPEALAEQLLLSHEFDIYIARLPYASRPNPDALYPLFHSRFSTELGWQNPFGFTDLDCDDLLETQRTATGESRQTAVDKLQTLLARTQPCTPLVLPEEPTGVRTDRFSGWESAVDRLPHGLLELQSADATSSTLRAATTDSRITTNWNPISATHHTEQSLLGLLYDPLAVDTDDRQLPWLATELTWDESPLQVTVELREGLTWHDGEPLTASDVAFSYRFLADTARGSAPNPIPAPRFRGESTLVEDVHVSGDREVTIEFADTTRPVAEQALTVLILPAHIWQHHTDTASVAGIEIDGATTEALVIANEEPVGSGPLQFSSATANSEVVFSRFDDHFLTTTDDDRLLRFAGGPAFEQLVVKTVAAHGGVVELLATGEADITLSPISPTAAARIDTNPALALQTHRSHAIYHLGFNSRREPLSNPNVRRLVARLVDKAFLADEVFEGFGHPVASLLADTDWLTSDLEWTAEKDPVVPFFGTDGELDAEAARAAFQEAGFRYNEDGELLVQSP